MAENIRMTPALMRERAGQYRDQADTITEIISSMDNLLSMLQNEWEGASSEGYSERYQQLRPGFLNAVELIQEMAKALDASVTAIEGSDTDSSNQISGPPTK